MGNDFTEKELEKFVNELRDDGILTAKQRHEHIKWMVDRLRSHLTLKEVYNAKEE